MLAEGSTTKFTAVGTTSLLRHAASKTFVQARFSYPRGSSGRFCRFAEFEDPDCIDLNDYADDTVDGRFDAGHAQRN